jgi:hypothetical protein
MENVEAAPSPESTAPTALDGIVLDLQHLRAEVGAPSYAEIANRVRQQRLSAGATEDAARVARSSVYDCFRPGRARIRPDLVGEIAAALTGNPSDAEAWSERCGFAMAAMEPATLAVDDDHPVIAARDATSASARESARQLVTEPVVSTSTNTRNYEVKQVDTEPVVSTTSTTRNAAPDPPHELSGFAKVFDKIADFSAFRTSKRAACMGVANNRARRPAAAL